jgi:23S rRNA (cytosine1962-C5)-methyltransferase
LLEDCRSLLSEKPLFFLVNTYTTGLSPTALGNVMTRLLSSKSGTITTGEVGLPIERDGTVLPCGIYGRWLA